MANRKSRKNGLKNTPKRSLKNKKVSTQKSKTTTKSTIKKAQPAKTSKLADLISILGIVLFALFLTAFTGTFIYQKLTQPQSISELLPAQQTIGFVELTINPSHPQVAELQNALAAYPDFSLTSFKSQLSENFQINFDQQIMPWIGRQIGVSLISKEKNVYRDYSPLLFIETRDKEKTLEFLRTLELEGGNDALVETYFERTPVYKYPISHNFHFTFINNYLVVANNIEAIETLITAQNHPAPKIVETSEFLKVRNNLPRRRMGLGYLNSEHTLEVLKRNPKILAEKTHQLKAFDPYLSLFKSAGFSLAFENKNLFIQQFTFLDKDKMKDLKPLVSNQKFYPALTRAIEPKSVVYAGGQAMDLHIQGLIEVFARSNTRQSVQVKDFIDSQIIKFLGPEISLEQDIYPLLQKEFAFVAQPTSEKPDFKMIFELSDPEKDISRFKKLISSFKRISPRFAPKKVPIVLADGTPAFELVADSESVVTESSTYKDTQIHSINMGDQNWGVHYAVLSLGKTQVAVVASQLESIQSTINILLGEKENFTQTSQYNKSVKPHLSHADSLLYVNLEILAFAAFSEYLQPVQNFVMSKKYFADGVSTIYTIKVK